MENVKPITEIDIIMLSYSHNEELKQMTENAIRSLIDSEDANKIKFNIILIESEKKLKPYQYPNTTTIYPNQVFGYHRYMNVGIRMTKARYVCLCNNDLYFHKFSLAYICLILYPFHL